VFDGVEKKRRRKTTSRQIGKQADRPFGKPPMSDDASSKDENI
jgi:hypothetical protein